MVRLWVIFTIASSALQQLADAGSSLRGVSPSYSRHYEDPDTFSCILNPSISISASQVNDDYCDCPDGSDEPGTSACSHISPLSPPSVLHSEPNHNYSAALPGFYCANAGHRPTYIPFAYVNDGVCDYEGCCDGSDEWAHVGGVKCENKCKEIGAAWQKKDIARRTARMAALKKRVELVAQAKQLKSEIEKTISDLRVQLSQDEAKLKEAEQTLADEEKKDKLRAIRAPASGGRLGVLVSLAQERVTGLKAALQKSQDDKKAAETRVRELETLLDTFKTEYNPNFNDEGVKRAVRAWEDYEARGKQLPNNDAEDRDIEHLMGDDSQHGITWAEYQTEERDTDTLYILESYLPPTVRAWVSQKLQDLRYFLVENGILPSSRGESGAESKTVTEARNRLQSLQSERDNRQNSLASNERDAEKSYGPDDVFLTLKNQCFTVDSGEYTYEHCFLDKTVQKPNKGGMDTTMGHFDRIEWITVDEEEAADGKGLGSGERLAIKYENGAHCWNGPARSTTVILACAAENEIWRVIEEEKCSYRMEAGSPAACPAEDVDAGPIKVKDEL